MMKILPINLQPRVTSYVHHSYTNAIADRDFIAKLYLQDVFAWKMQATDLLCEMDSDTIICRETKFRKNDRIELIRTCKEQDEVILRLCEIKLVDALSYVEVKVVQNNEKELFSFHWNQYDVTAGDEHFIPEDHFYSYYKTEVSNGMVNVFISEDKTEWYSLFSKECNTQNGDEEIALRVNLYFGKNQYEQWFNMNYIQLFYCENDPNLVFLDYYMFPRKLSDASFQHLCHFCDTEYIDFQLLQKVRDTTICRYIEESILQNYYVNVCLDEYYFSGRAAFEDYHYSHYNLVYGFDDTRKVFLCMGYNGRGKLVTDEISYEILCKSFDIEQQLVRYIYRVNKYNYCFDLPAFIQSLTELANGLNSGIHYAPILTNCNGTFGLQVFDELLHSEIGRDLVVKDSRISFVLYEHCLLLQDKITFLRKNNYLTDSEENDLGERCREALQTAERLKNLVIKNHLIKEKKEDAILECLKLLKDREKTFVDEMIMILNAKEPKKPFETGMSGV